MPKFKILAERNLSEAWTYIVTAKNADEAIEKCQECPDGECDDVVRLQDDQVYSDDIEFSLIEKIKK